MIIETLTVTPTPTSIYSLLVTAGRDLVAEGKDLTIKTLNFRIDEASVKVVYASEADTVTPVILVDPAKGQPYAHHDDYNLHQTLLSVGSDTVLIGLIASQH